MQYSPIQNQGLSCGQPPASLILYHPTIFTSPSVTTEELKVLQKCFAILYFCAFAQGNTMASHKCLFWELHYSIRVLMLPNRSSCPQRVLSNCNISLEWQKGLLKDQVRRRGDSWSKPWTSRWLLGISVYIKLMVSDFLLISHYREGNRGAPGILCSVWGYHPPLMGASVPWRTRRYCNVFPSGGARTLLHHCTVLSWLLSLCFLLPPKFLSLLFGTQGSSWRLKEVGYVQTRNRRHGKERIFVLLA